MGLQESYSRFSDIVRGLSKWACYVGSAIVVAMMFLIVVDVTMRGVFNRPINGTFELVEFMMALSVGLGMAFTGVKNGHVSVDLIVSKFPLRIQIYLDRSSHLLCAVFFGLMCWKTGIQAKIFYKAGAESTVLGIQKTPFIWVLCLCCGLLALVFFMQMIDSFTKVDKK